MTADVAEVVRQDAPNAAAGAMPVAPNRTRLTDALQLGWRVAELYAQVNDTGEPLNDTLLPAHESLEPADQLELQLRAAAGAARRLGVGGKGALLERLIPYAREAPESSHKAEVFRSKVCSCHVELAKDLWAYDEAAGKAYELGNGMSDTYGRICRAYREGEDAETAWTQVFDSGRIERLRKLLDDLQSRLDPSGVAVVRHQLGVWRDNVPQRLRARSGPPPLQKVREGLRRQTVIWRQLISGDKEPEAYLDSEARAAVRGEMLDLMWRRCRAWILPAGAILFVLALFLPDIVDWYRDGHLRSSAASAVVAVGGALGITRASVLLTIRTRVHQWSELLWNRALATKVSDKTLILDAVLPPPPPERHTVAQVAAAVRREARARVTPLRGSMRPRRTSI